MTSLERICRALRDASVPYAVVGGYAVALHGAVRGTIDIDLALSWSSRDLEAAEAALTGIGLVSRLPLTAHEVHAFRDEYVSERGLVAWNFYNPEEPSERVDLVIAYDLAGKRTTTVDLPDGPVQVLAINELIDMKRASGRPQDLEDARALELLR